MDQTLGQILSLLYQLQVRVESLTTENSRLKQIIDSKLPVQEATPGGLQASVNEATPNDQ